MKRTLPLLLLLGAVVASPAQNILLKDGKTIPGTKLRRDGASVMTTVQIGTGMGEIGYEISKIASIDFPEPPQLKEAAGQVAAGKLDQALTTLDPILTYYRNFKEIKGSFWGDAAILKLQILTTLGRDREAEPLLREMLATREMPEVVTAATAAKALLATKTGNAKEALSMSNEILKQEGTDSATSAIAYLANGHAHFALKEYKDANFAYLHLPIFFPDQKAMMPTALLGSARCYAKLQTKNEFEAELDQTIKDLINSYPSSPEAATAKAEFPNAISRIQKSNK
jgi:hypothetical protein